MPSSVSTKSILTVLSLLIVPVTLLLVKGFSSERSQLINNDSTVENTISAESPVKDKLIPFSDRRADLFLFPSTKYLRLDGSNLPKGLQALKELRVRAAPGEYEPLSFLISANEDLENVEISWNNFSGSTNELSREVIDPYIVKVWYQAGIKNTDLKNKLLTQELLLKNDNLIKADEQLGTNFIKVQNESGEFEYIDISSPDAVFPEGVTIKDSRELQPFSIRTGKHKLIWLTLHIPQDQAAEVYSGTLNIRDTKGLLSEVPIEIEVLPFKFSPSILLYGIYYHGYYDNVSKRAFHFTNKNENLYRTEMKDLKAHGIMYPTTYQILKHLHNDLRIRNEVGFPRDKLFSVGLKTGNPQAAGELNKFENDIKRWKKKIQEYGYDTLFIYGIDEARGALLKSQRPAWSQVHSTGAKVFVAGYYETFQDMGDLLNIAIIQGPLDPEQARLYHSKGQRILSYSNPQAGEENPEVYRRNFGLALWKAGYDGAMEYAYQKNYNSTWNDFDHHKYREENFTYPTSDGIVSTIQWEGFREGIDDVKYLSTLLDRINQMKLRNLNTDDLENWVSKINPDGDLDKIRSEIINKILSTYSSGI